MKIKSYVRLRDLVPLELSGLKYFMGTRKNFGLASAIGQMSPLFNLVRHFGRFFAVVACCAIAFLASGCTTASNNATVAALQNPNSEAIALEGTVTIVANRVLAKNPSYAAEALALADVIASAAQGSEASGVTAPDIAAILATPGLKIDAGLQGEITSDYNTALGLFNATFQLKFPTLKPSYNIFLLAFANGIYTAEGKPTVAIPVIPWPPTPTTAPGSA